MDEFLRRVSAIEPGDVEHLALVLTDRIEHLAAILDELEAIRTEQDATLTELGERLEAADAVDHEEVADESLTVAAQLDEMARYNDEVTAELRVHREILTACSRTPTRSERRKRESPNLRMVEKRRSKWYISNQSSQYLLFFLNL
ncbi:hypothetical protein ACFQH3_07095 [Haladaptatus sp. GCM10025707]|uniref:hypothetical protein n=1 Tax=unclassified Haladaptatus TaxID=2622732 RepID=UPI00361CE96E